LADDGSLASDLRAGKSHSVFRAECFQRFASKGRCRTETICPNSAAEHAEEVGSAPQSKKTSGGQSGPPAGRFKTQMEDLRLYCLDRRDKVIETEVFLKSIALKTAIYRKLHRGEL
jgi:hypothetical protein